MEKVLQEMPSGNGTADYQGAASNRDVFQHSYNI